MTAWHIDTGSFIETTGAGQTARWKGWVGTVTDVTNHHVDDGTLERLFTVQFKDPDIKPTVLKENEIRLQRRAGCPCARCNDHD